MTAVVLGMTHHSQNRSNLFSTSLQFPVRKAKDEPVLIKKAGELFSLSTRKWLQQTEKHKLCGLLYIIHKLYL